MPRYDIFVSYSRADNSRVLPLVELLRSRGYRVFYDQKEILVADKWKERLSRSVVKSRVLLLCWSREAAASEYVRYELFRAEGLRKPVLPWLLDNTELPRLIEIQGIVEAEAAQVLDRLRPRLGLQLRWRRALEVLAVFLLAVACLASYRYAHRPWLLSGTVRSTADESPLAGVTVEVTTPNRSHYKGDTQTNGRYAISIPLPKPAAVDVLFRKSGFQSDHEISVTTTHDYVMYLRPAE